MASREGNWEAARIAYAMMADYVKRAEADRGERVPPGKVWDDLPPLQRHDVLQVLSAHARVAMWTARQSGRHADIAWTLQQAGADELCHEARGALTALLAPEPAPWMLPACTHCAGITAAALCAVQLGIYVHLGFEPEQVAGLAAAVADGSHGVPRPRRTA